MLLGANAQASLEGLLALAFLLSVVSVFVFSIAAVKGASERGIESFQAKANAEACALMADAIYSNSVYAEIEAECSLSEEGKIYSSLGKNFRVAVPHTESLEAFHTEKGVVTGVEASMHYR